MNAIRLFALVALTLAVPATVSAQSTLDSSEAQAFLGSWVLSFESPQGEFAMDLVVSDMSGKVGATVSADMIGSSTVTDITDGMFAMDGTAAKSQ